jgi:hypothetical protein
MPATITLADFVTQHGGEDVVPLVEVASRPVPELTGEQYVLGRRVQLEGVPYWHTIKGISYPTLLRTALGDVGFRQFGEGANNGKCTYTKKTVETFPLTVKAYVDKQLADIDPDGPTKMMVREMTGLLEAVMKWCGRQFYLGTGLLDSLGFPGFRDVIDTTNMVVDATGSTADTGSQVWGVRFGEQDVSWVFGNEAKFELSDIDVRDKVDSNGRPVTCYHQEIAAMVGLQVLDPTSVGVIKNLTAQVGKTLTDEMIGELVDKFPEGKPPHVLFMSGRSRRQLTNSRTATSETGHKAPTAVDHEGIPIIASSQVGKTDAIW